MSAPEQTFTYKLFHSYYSAQVPEHFFHSPETIRERGTLTTGDRAYDLELMQEPRILYLTIPQMADLHAEGAGIKLTNPHDAVPIYTQIKEHLRRWRWIIDTQYNYKAPPVEDFHCLEALASYFHTSVQVMNHGRTPDSDHMARLRKSTTRRLGRSIAANAQPNWITPMTAFEPVAGDLAKAAWRRL